VEQKTNILQNNQKTEKSFNCTVKKHLHNAFTALNMKTFNKNTDDKQLED